MSTGAEYEPPTEGAAPLNPVKSFSTEDLRSMVDHFRKYNERMENAWQAKTLELVREQKLSFGPYERPAKAYMRREIRARTPQYIAPRTN